MTGTLLTPALAPTTGTRPPMPPPAPDRRWRAALVALLLTAAVLALPGQPRTARAVLDRSPDLTAPWAGAMALGPLTRGPVVPGWMALGWVAAGVVPTGVVPLGATGSGRAWPVGGRSGLLRGFDAPSAPWTAGHRGVDLDATTGVAVRAAAPGVVAFSGMVAGRPVVTLQHPGSGNPPLRTTYLPVSGTVPVGTAVSAGEVIGTVTDAAASGAEGHCPAVCVHWGLLRGDRYLDPLALFGAGRARLLPLKAPPTPAPGSATG